MTQYQSFSQQTRHAQAPVKILDGGMGRELFRQGVPEDRSIWSARALVEPHYNQKVVDAHLAFIRAGARYITTSNYAVIPGYLKHTRHWQHFDSLTELAGQLARRAVDTWKAQGVPGTDDAAEHLTDPVKIAGCLPPLVESFRPDLILPVAEAEKFYTRIIDALSAYVDLFLMETLSGLAEFEGAYVAVKQQRKPYWASFTVTRGQVTRSGESIAAIAAHVSQLEHAPEALLFNCARAEDISDALSLASKHVSPAIELGAYANAFPKQPAVDFTLDKGFSDSLRPLSGEQYLSHVQAWQALGCRIVGGCCGISPAHIQQITQSVMGGRWARDAYQAADLYHPA